MIATDSGKTVAEIAAVEKLVHHLGDDRATETIAFRIVLQMEYTKLTKNIAGQYPEVVKKLSNTLNTYKESGRSRPVNHGK